jgi:hypothetical protein
MKFSPTSSVAVLLLLMLLGCSRSATDETASDSTSYEGDSLEYATSDEVIEPSSEPLVDVVDYYGSIDDDVKVALASFEPLEKVLAVARKAIYFKDSIERERGVPDLTDPNDSALYLPKMREAYAAITAYQAAMQDGIKTTDKCPKLTDIVRTPGEGDKTSDYLPRSGTSNLLSDGDFFFLGGWPFIMREQDVAAGPGGKPEYRYYTMATENANYLFNSVYHQVGGGVDVTFGPPLRSYESGEQEVNGVGSLLHTFKKRIPVYFMTSSGPVDGTLISVNIKLVPEGMGCVQDEPFYTFASFEDLADSEIMGVFIPYKNITLENMRFYSAGPGVWSFDLDGDGTSELAQVAGVFQGISSDQMNEVLWFMNIDGEWRILDWGSDPDCT